MPAPIDRREVQRLLEAEQAQLVEVLPAAEHEDEHLLDAINIPLKELRQMPLSKRLLAAWTAWLTLRKRGAFAVASSASHALTRPHWRSAT